MRERLGIIENEVTHIKENLKNIRENELRHIYDKLDKITVFCETLKADLRTIKNNSKSKLTGRDKAVVYGAALAGFASIIVALIGAFT